MMHLFLPNPFSTVSSFELVGVAVLFRGSMDGAPAILTVEPEVVEGALKDS
jgi:hypothetical protein